ncbi:MAG: ADP-ribose pyrophosphatase [Firmicutes bacterium HGW-Firmicutes-12]|nr:MAG: ADP-ribose pyrophosphatase [Firmicutes bacterium HGW-Firmicutes-12]
MEEKYVKTLQEASGKYIKFRQDEVILSNGKKASREMVLHPGAVAIAALTEENELLMVRQYRYPIKEVSFELPAGKLEKDEDPLASAKRELEEETGFWAKDWEKLTAFFTSPGFANEIIHLYLARGLEERKAHPDPGEIIEYEKIPIKKLREQLNTGDIKDAKTIIGLLWTLERIGNGEISTE